MTEVSFGTKAPSQYESRLRGALESASKKLGINKVNDLIVEFYIANGDASSHFRKLGKKAQKKIEEQTRIKELKQKEQKESLKYQKSTHNQFRLLAQQNSVTRIEALNEWRLSDLKDVLKEISDKRRLEGVSDHMLRQAKADLVQVIQAKEMLK